jgi:polysaccharide deacetylase family protein (PEP-CTERM system associated)
MSPTVAAEATPSAPRSSLPNALTVDVEDYFHVEAFAGVVPRDRWDSYPLRVVENTRRVLDLFDRHGVKGTFFVLGWVARKAPEIVRDIARRGHEVGCHSFWHRRIYRLSPEEFRADLREATKVIEDAAQTRLRGHRAPSYSVTKDSLWALQVLAEEGYAYDSSIFPIRHDIYGMPDFPRSVVRVELDGGASIVEFPPSTVRIFGRNLPGPGGGYLRIFPLAYARWALRRIAARDGMPGTVYIHPWEVDPGQPRIAGPLRSRLRHYTNLARTQGRLEKLLEEFPFEPMGSVLAAYPPARTVRRADLGQLPKGR